MGRILRWFSRSGGCDIISVDGSVSEWFKEHAWKACERATVPEVRILSLPPGNLNQNGLLCKFYLRSLVLRRVSLDRMQISSILFLDFWGKRG